MENISLKIQEDVAKKIDLLSKMFNYNTKTEFIREAIRDKINALELAAFEKDLRKHFGKAKVKVSDEDLERTRRELGNKLFADTK